MFRQFGLSFILALLTLLTLGPVSSATLAQSQSAIFHSVDGREVKLADQKGKIIVMSFGGTWVPLASKELPALQKIADRYSSRGVQVYWVSINSSKPGARNYASDADLQAFTQKHNLRVTALRDPDQTAYKSFGLDAVPTVVIIDQQGNIAHKHVGFGSDQGEAYGDLIRVIERLLK
ncbi:MAG TPA: TlpA disulfide reductase family protein [Blastocatellia bacterium]|jgi:peroxiredoxin|nr:TlpA disulfide reductase family protein [Blastocatellia bacterium]